MTYYMTPYRQMVRMLDAFSPTPRPNTNVHIPVNVQVEDEAYVITALLPGLESEDVSIQVLDDVVSIRGELKPTASEEAKHLLKEIPTGEFRRVLRLPVALDPEKAEAEIINGILNLRVPKAETARPKTIEVKAK